MWGCGLKFGYKSYWSFAANVTPYVGVWIEICCPVPGSIRGNGHPLGGGVD